MKKDIIFIALAYRNWSDLEDFCDSVNKNVRGNYKIIVVDSYYNDECSQKIEAMAKSRECDYLRVENRGYGYGNNRGIEYAEAHYDYNWIVICNPDTVIESSINTDLLRKYGGVIAPNITCKTGKKQNPFWVRENLLAEKMMYHGYSRDNMIFTYMGIIINKIIREIFLIYTQISKKQTHKIFACHGSFLFIHHEFVDDLKYDENIFLFFEEACMANEAKKKGIPIYYMPSLKIMHKEDGSIGVSDIKENVHLKKSYLYYYRKYRLER